MLRSGTAHLFALKALGGEVEGTRGIGPYKAAVAPLPAVSAYLTGVSRDSSGAPLGNCVCTLFKVDTTGTLPSYRWIAVTVSDAIGNYSFPVGLNGPFRVTFDPDAATDLAGLTLFTLQGVAGPVAVGIPTIFDLQVVDATETTIEVYFTASTWQTSKEYRLDGGSAVTLAADNIITGLTTGVTYGIEVRETGAAGTATWSNKVYQQTVGAKASAGTITSAQSGFWSSPTTWVGYVVPTYGKDVQINHAVTVDVPVTIGQSGAPTNTDRSSGAAATLSVSVATTASLAVAFRKTLRSRGDIVCRGSGRLEQAPGAVIELDGSLAAAPSTAAYCVAVGDAHNVSPLWRVIGTSAARCKVRSNSSGANGYTSSEYGGGGGWLQSGMCEWNYVDVLRFGSSANNSMSFNLSNSVSHSVQNANFDACGKIGGQLNMGTTCNLTMVNVKMTNTVSTIGFAPPNNSGFASGTRLISKCVFDKQVQFFTPEGFTVDDCYFNEKPDNTANLFANFRRNTIRITDALNTYTHYGIMQDCFLFYDEPAAVNPHFMQILNSGSPAGTYAVRGTMFYFNGPDGGSDRGDCISVSTPAATRALEISRCIVLRGNGLNDAAGTLMSALGGATSTPITIEHNTMCTGSTQGGVAVAETYAGHVGMYASIKSNLFYSIVSNTARKVYDSPTKNSPRDIVLASNVDYNSGWNLDPALNRGKGYNDLDFTQATVTITNASPGVVTWTTHGFVANDALRFTTTGTLPAPLATGTTYYVLSTGLTANDFQIAATPGGAAINTTTAGSGVHTGEKSPGARDVDIDPKFLDETRNPITWDLSLGGAGTTAAVLARFKADPTTATTMMNWIKEGFTPYETTLQTAAHDGGRIGAV